MASSIYARRAGLVAVTISMPPAMAMAQVAPPTDALHSPSAVQNQPAIFAASQTQTFAQDDTLLEGMLIGLGVGIGVGYALVRKNCGPPGYDDECTAIANRVFYPISIAGGIAIGALVDKAIRKTLHLPVPRGGQPAPVVVASVISPARKGVSIAVRF
jgi:hypothetical protein